MVDHKKYGRDGGAGNSDCRSDCNQSENPGVILTKSIGKRDVPPVASRSPGVLTLGLHALAMAERRRRAAT